MMFDPSTPVTGLGRWSVPQTQFERASVVGVRDGSFPHLALRHGLVTAGRFFLREDRSSRPRGQETKTSQPLSLRVRVLVSTFQAFLRCLEFACQCSTWLRSSLSVGGRRRLPA
jgi:hypothetical protein